MRSLQATGEGPLWAGSSGLHQEQARLGRNNGFIGFLAYHSTLEIQGAKGSACIEENSQRGERPLLLANNPGSTPTYFHTLISIAFRSRRSLPSPPRIDPLIPLLIENDRISEPRCRYPALQPAFQGGRSPCAGKARRCQGQRIRLRGNGISTAARWASGCTHTDGGVLSRL